MNCSRFLGLLVLFVFAFTLCSQGQANAGVTDFTCGEGGTFATGLNDVGQVVGWVGDFSTGQSFIKKKSADCILLDRMPGSAATIALGVNDPGQIVGIVFPGNHGYGNAFLLDKGEYIQLDEPTANTCQMWAFSINNRGQIVGVYDEWKEGNVCDGPDRPFLREANGTLVIPPTLPLPPGAQDSVQANGINPRGTIIGNYLVCEPNGSECTEKEYGYVRYASDATFITIIAKNSADTMPTGINPQGQIVGRFFDEVSTDPLGPCRSFFKENKDAVPVELKYRDAGFTCLGAINASGEVSGSWTNNPSSLSSWRSFVVDVTLLTIVP